MRPAKRTISRRVFWSFVISGFVAVAFLAIPVKRGLWKWRFEKTIQEAEKALASQDLSLAHEQLVLAWEVSTRSADQLRDLLELSRTLRSASYETIADTLLKQVDVTGEDYRQVLEGALSLGRLDFFRKVEGELPSSLAGDRKIGFLKSRVLQQEGRLEAAFLSTQDWLTDAPSAEEWILIRELLSGLDQDPAARRLAVLLIQREMAGEDERALRGFRAIADLDKAGDLFRGDQLLLWLDQRKLGGVEERLFAAGLHVRRLEGEEREKLLEQIVEQYEQRDPGALAKWLLENQASERLPALSSERAQEDLTTFLAKVQSLIDDEQYTEALKLLETPHSKMKNYFLEATKAGLEFQTGNSIQGIFYRERALEAASLDGTYQAHQVILKLAERFKDGKGAQKIAEAIMRLSPDEWPPAVELVFLERYLDYDGKKGADFYERVHAARPHDRFARYRYALLLTVSGGDLSRARRLLIPLNHDSPAASLSAALALTELGQNPEMALEQLSEYRGEKLAAPDRAVMATVLFMNDQKREAAALSEFLESDDLPPYLLSHLRTYWPDFLK